MALCGALCGSMGAPFMNGFDYSIIAFLTQFSNRAPWFDETIAVVAQGDLFKGGVLVAVLWWAWFLPGREAEERREVVLATMVSAICAVGSARGLALVLPHRPRPMVALGGQGAAADWADWSAFPSDHAALFVAMAAGLFGVSRRVGTVAMTYVVFVICLPRIYLGLHYPTDILGGAALGLAWIGFGLRRTPRRRIAKPFLTWQARSPASFYATAFLASYLVATLFADLRALGSVWMTLLRGPRH